MFRLTIPAANPFIMAAQSAVPEMVPPQSLNKVANIDAFTTTNGLRAIHENEIEWQAAIANNLVAGQKSERFGSALISE